MTKTRKKTRALSPMAATSFENVCRLKTDNAGAGDYWIITDGYYVTLANQEDGSAPTASVSIPLKEFNALIRWYLRPQTTRPKE